MMIRNTSFRQAMCPIAPLLLGLTLLTGCPSHIALTKSARESIRAVSINKDVKLPGDMFYYGTEQVGAGMFGLVGALASAAAVKGPKAQLKAAMQEGQIDVAQIVREQFATQLVESHVFSSIIPEGGEAEIRLEVRQFGFATQFGSGGSLQPTLGVMGSLVRTDGTVLWQHYVLVTSGDDQTPRHILEEYVEKPQLIREAYIVAAKVASNALVKHMRQE